MNCEQVELLLPAYALGSLDPADRQAVEDHLYGCPTCTPLARENLEVAVALATAIPPNDPPPQLRGRIMAAASQHTGGTTPKAVAGKAPYEVAWRRRLPWKAPAMVLAAGFGLVLIGVLLSVVLDLRGQVQALREDNRSLASTVGEQNQRLVSMIKEQRSLAYTVALPGTQTLLLSNTEQAPKARGMLMVSQDQTWAILVSEGLDPTPRSMGYQIWLINNGWRISGGIFTVDETGYGQLFIRFPTPLREFSGIRVTVEPKEGSPGPTGTKVLDARLR